MIPVVFIALMLRLSVACWSDCISSLDHCFNCLKDKISQNQFKEIDSICNLWDKSECSKTYYQVKSIHQQLIINESANEKSLNLSFLSSSTINIRSVSSEVFKTNSERNCTIIATDQNIFQSGILISTGNEENLIWIVGKLIENFFQGFIDIKILKGTSKINVECLDTPKSEDCDECDERCPIWMLPNHCKGIHKRFLSSCYYPCLTCWSGLPTRCITCQTPYYYFAGCCYANCPAGTKAATNYYNSRFCKETSIYHDRLDFYQIETLPSSYTLGSISSGSNPTWWSERGWYFDGTGYIKSTSIYSLFFSISFFIHLEDSHDGSYSNTLNFILSTSASPLFWAGICAQWFSSDIFIIKVFESYTPTYLSSVNSLRDSQSWNYYYLSFEMQDYNTGLIRIYENQNLIGESNPITYPSDYQQNLVNSKYIGANPEKGIYGFKGFMYYYHSFHYWGEAAIQNLEVSTLCNQAHSVGVCSICPSWTLNCINNCRHDLVYDNEQCVETSCSSCSYGCPHGASKTWNCDGCVASDYGTISTQYYCNTCNGWDSCSSCPDTMVLDFR